MVNGSHAEILQERMHRGKRHHSDGKRQDAAQSLHLVLENVAQGNLQVV